MILLDLTWGQIDSFLGTNASSIVGNNPMIAGAIVSLIFLVLSFRMGVGLEGTIIIGAFMIVALSLSIVNTGGLIPMMIASGLVIIVAFIWYLAFFQDSFR